MRWGMVIDLGRCIGCYACALACKAENGTPPGVYFRRILTHEEGRYPTVRRVPVPVSCNHCADAPCVSVCPSGASYQTDEGVVLVDETKCIGCRACMMACPYKNRSFLKQRRAYFPETGFTPMEESGGEARIDWGAKVNAVVKCTFCLHRLEAAKKTGLTPGVDRAATPACVITCPARAMVFGDLDDPQSEISRLIVTRGGFQLRPEAGTSPSVCYLPAR
jgi:phenylacetyl-CoA:acceptor oxidoreductase 27-kDa subunit